MPPPVRVGGYLSSSARFLGHRLLQVGPVLAIVTFLTTSLASLIPGSPATAVYGTVLSPQAQAKFDAEFGLNHPLLVRYWDWIVAALHGNFGISYFTREKVSHLLVSRAPVTIEIAILGLVFSLLVGVPLALVASERPGGIIDRTITAITSFAHSTPPFASAVFLVIIFAVRLRWVPPNGWVAISSDLWGNIAHAALPVVTLTLVTAPTFARVLRGDLVSVMNQDFIASARARGLPEWYVLSRHAFRPSSISLVTVAGIAFGHLIGGAIIVESFYGLPGIGNLAAQAVLNKDIPILQAVVVVVAVAFVVINGVVDVSYGLIDPRIRRSR